MKRVLIFLFLFLISLSLISSADPIEGTGEDIQGRLDDLETAREDILDNPKKWDLLGEEWNKIFLSYPAVMAFDSFMTKVSFVFLIFIGVDYSFSIDFLLALIFGIFLVVNLGILLKYAPPMDKFNWAFSILIVLILARVSFFSGAVLVTKGLFNTLGTFIDIASLLIAIGIVLFVVIMLSSQKAVLMFKEYLEEKKKMYKRMRRTMDEDTLHDLTSKLSAALSSSSDYANAINKTTNPSDGKKLWKDGINKFHPDKGGTDEDFIKINDAYDGRKKENWKKK